MHTQSRLTLCDPMDWSPTGSSFPGDSPGKNTGVGCNALLQGIFLTQGSNLHLLQAQASQVALEIRKGMGPRLSKALEAWQAPRGRTDLRDETNGTVKS